MRILYCANDPVPFPKGAGVRIEATVQALRRAGAHVTLVSPRVPKPAPFPEKLAGFDHRLIDVGPGGDPFLDRALRFRRGVEGLLSEGRWDLFWFRSPWEGWALQRAASPLPFVYEAHGFPSIELPHHYPGLAEQPEFLGRLGWEESTLLRQAQALLTPSQTGARFLRSRGADPRRVHVVPNSVRDEAFLDRNEGPGLRCVYTGTLAPWQGLETLLESLLHLKNKVPLEVHLVGTRKGRWTRRLRGLAQQLRVRSAVQFLGPFAPEELREHLKTCHIGLVPLPADQRNTVQGCCPIKLVEFMAAGLPVLSTRLPVVQELVEHDVSAWLVRPNSPWALAQGLKQLAADPELRARLGAAAQERARRDLHRDQFDARIAAVLAETQARSQ